MEVTWSLQANAVVWTWTTDYMIPLPRLSEFGV